MKPTMTTLELNCFTYNYIRFLRSILILCTLTGFERNTYTDAVMMQMEDDEIEAEAAEEQEDSSGPRKF